MDENRIRELNERTVEKVEEFISELDKKIDILTSIFAKKVTDNTKTEIYQAIGAFMNLKDKMQKYAEEINPNKAIVNNNETVLDESVLSEEEKNTENKTEVVEKEVIENKVESSMNETNKDVKIELSSEDMDKIDEVMRVIKKSFSEISNNDTFKTLKVLEVLNAYVKSGDIRDVPFNVREQVEAIGLDKIKMYLDGAKSEKEVDFRIVNNENKKEEHLVPVNGSEAIILNNKVEDGSIHTENNNPEEDTKDKVNSKIFVLDESKYADKFDKLIEKEKSLDSRIDIYDGLLQHDFKFLRNKLEKKLDKLKNKKGSIQERQNQIVDKAIKEKLKKYSERLKKYDKLSNSVEKMNNYNDKQSKKIDDANVRKDNLVSAGNVLLDSSNLLDKGVGVGMKLRSKLTATRLFCLKKKHGVVNFAQNHAIEYKVKPSIMDKLKKYTFNKLKSFVESHDNFWETYSSNLDNGIMPEPIKSR